MFVTELIFNLSLLVALVVLAGFLDQRWPREHRLGQVLQGLLFGGAAVIGMLYPLVLEPGLIFDGRTVMVSLAALFYGPWAAGVALVMTIGARVAMGGVGVAMGVFSVVVAAGIGLLAYYYLRPRRKVLGVMDLYLFGLLVHLGMLSGVFLLPGEIASAVLFEVGLPILLFYPLGTLLAGKILVTQEALRNSERNYRQLFDDHAAVKLLIDPDDGRIVDANLAAALFYGWSQSDLKQMQISQINTLSAEQIRTEMAEAGRRQRYHFEFKHRLADGTVRDVAVFNSPILADGRALLHSIILDITEQKKAEKEHQRLTDQLFQARKMETVGRLAGGVAHEFNNLMTTVIANAHLAGIKVGPQSPAAEELSEIKTAGERAAKLTRQLLAFAHQQTIIPEVLDLNGAVEGFLPLLRQLIDQEMDLRWQPGPDLPPVRLDPDQLDQLLVNLVRNAKEAVGTKGVITIATATNELDQAFCDEHPGARPGRYIALMVRDDGCGMDRETLDKVFEPFFTTREFGQGSGLGLSTTYGIIKQNEGFIDVVSAPGQGTTVTIYLPLTAMEQER